MIFNWRVFLAVRWIKAGYVIAYPTESVFGLGCDPQNLNALKKILEIKQRSASKGLILVASDIEQIFPYIKKLSPEAITKITSPSKLAITWLIPANENISTLLTGTHTADATQLTTEKKIAIRISQHPIIKALCQKLGHPIVSTSANVTGKPMCWSANEVKQQLKTGIKYILNGQCGTQTKVSEIRDLITDQQIRK